MEYIEFGKTGMRTSRFGLGCMRLPAENEKSTEIIRYAIDHGVNYLDTAWMYPGSEEKVGRALYGGYRDRVYIVTKCPMIFVNSYEDMEKYLDEELKRLRTDYVDMYLLHNLSPAVWEKTRKYDAFDFLDDMQRKGKILHRGFSLHNTFSALKEIISAFDWEMAQIQLNILDEEVQAGGAAGVRYAANHGLPVTIMEPLRGGSLLSNLSEEAKRLVSGHTQRRSFTEWAFRWLYSMPEVSVILSGVSTLDQLKENLNIFESSAPNVMRAEDLELIAKLRRTFEEQQLIGCTECKYCLPCPKSVMIPEIFRMYNSYMRTKDESIREIYRPWERNASKCVSCHLCERHCPQGLKIAELLKEVHGVLEG